MKPAIFLDRDGTLNVEKGYIHDVDHLELYDGAAEAVKQFKKAGYYCILTTNQSGPARGYYDEDHVRALNARIQKLLKDEADVSLDAMYYCPCLPDGTVPPYNTDSEDRKPKTGMIVAACRDFGDIDLSQSWVIGDKATDVEFGNRAGCRTVLLLSGYGLRVIQGTYQDLKDCQAPPTVISQSLGDAAACILASTLTARDTVSA